MIFKPDQNKIKIACLWSLFPLTIGIVLVLIDAIDGFVNYFSVISLFGFMLSSFYFHLVARNIYCCSFEVNNKFILRHHNNTIKHLDWEKINYVYIIPKSFFRSPYLGFITAEKERNIVFRISVLSVEDQLDLMTMACDLANEKSIETNFSVETTTIPN